MAALHAMGTITAAARPAMTATWAPNHAVPRSSPVVAVMAWPTWLISHTAPDATQLPAASKTADTPTPAALPATPEMAVHTVPTTGIDPGHRPRARCPVTSRPRSLHALPGVEEEVDDG